MTSAARALSMWLPPQLGELLLCLPQFVLDQRFVLFAVEPVRPVMRVQGTPLYKKLAVPLGRHPCGAHTEVRSETPPVLGAKTIPGQTGADMTEKDQGAKTDLKSEFMAAEEIKGILAGRAAPEQERIIRWVGESLGLTLHLRSRAPHPHGERAEPDASTDLPAETEVSRSGDTRPKDIKSFVQSKLPKGDIHFVATVAYFHRFIASERKEAITAEDVQEGARHSGRAVFKTPSTTMNNAVQQGYLDRGARGEYKLNAVGENLVTMTLPGAGVS